MLAGEERSDIYKAYGCKLSSVQPSVAVHTGKMISSMCDQTIENREWKERIRYFKNEGLSCRKPVASSGSTQNLLADISNEGK